MVRADFAHAGVAADVERRALGADVVNAGDLFRLSGKGGGICGHAGAATAAAPCRTKVGGLLDHAQALGVANVSTVVCCRVAQCLDFEVSTDQEGRVLVICTEFTVDASSPLAVFTDLCALKTGDDAPRLSQGDAALLFGSIFALGGAW